MLTLAEASSFFDRTPVLDPETGKLLFYGQIDPYQDMARDSATAYRRILSVAPGTTIPAAKVISVFGAVWIVGDKEIDGLQSPHRVKYVLHPGRIKANVSTLSQYLTGAVATTAWSDVGWTKDEKEQGVSSRVIPLFTLYLPLPVPAPEYSVVWSSEGAYLTQDPHPAVSGFQETISLRLPNAPEDATLTTRTYNPVTGSYATPAPATLKCLRIRWQSLYLYGSPADVSYLDGDMSFVLPTGTAVTTKDTLTVASKTWAIMAIDTIGGAVVVHGRPV